MNELTMDNPKITQYQYNYFHSPATCKDAIVILCSNLIYSVSYSTHTTSPTENPKVKLTI